MGQIDFNSIQFNFVWIGLESQFLKKSVWKKKLGRQFKLDVWIVKNWQFKQNIQIELIKIDNSNKTFKLNWKNWKFNPKNQIELKNFNFK